MSTEKRKLVRVEEILEIAPIPEADAIEVAMVGGWKVVVKKGVFTKGEKGVFFEIDSIIPRKGWSNFLFRDEKQECRLRTVKLRKQISQGLLVPLHEIPEICAANEDEDLSDLLGVKKYEPPIPKQLASVMKGNFPHFLRKTDEIRLQSAVKLLEEIKDKRITVRIKYDGTSFTAYKKDGEFGVCSRNMELKESDNAYWQIARTLNLQELIPDGFAIQGELCGPGIQGNKLGLTELTLYVFDVWDISAQIYRTEELLRSHLFTPVLEVAKEIQIVDDLRCVDDWLSLADSVKYPNGAQAEGIVVRCGDAEERVSFKVISNNFLLKAE